MKGVLQKKKTRESIVTDLYECSCTYWWGTKKSKIKQENRLCSFLEDFGQQTEKLNCARMKAS